MVGRTAQPAIPGPRTGLPLVRTKHSQVGSFGGGGIVCKLPNNPVRGLSHPHFGDWNSESKSEWFVRAKS